MRGEPEDAELDGGGSLADFAGSGPGVVAGISHSKAQGSHGAAYDWLGIGRREEGELGAVGAGRKGIGGKGKVLLWDMIEQGDTAHDHESRLLVGIRAGGRWQAELDLGE